MLQKPTQLSSKENLWLWTRCAVSLPRVALDHIVYLCGSICYHFQLHLLGLHTVFNYHRNWSKVSSDNNKVHSQSSLFSICPEPCEVLKVFLPWLPSFCSLQSSYFLSLLPSILLKWLVQLHWFVGLPISKHKEGDVLGPCIGRLHYNHGQLPCKCKWLVTRETRWGMDRSGESITPTTKHVFSW